MRELEKHIDAQLAHPAMGFDVDVLQLEYQRVTGFEAVSDDAVRLREMLQDVVAKEKKALRRERNKHLFSPETRRAVDAAEAAGGGRRADVSTAAAQDLEQDDVAFPDDDDEAGADAGEAPEAPAGRRGGRPDGGDAFAAPAAAVAATVGRCAAPRRCPAARASRARSATSASSARELVDGETRGGGLGGGGGGGASSRESAPAPRDARRARRVRTSDCGAVVARHALQPDGPRDGSRGEGGAAHVRRARPRGAVPRRERKTVDLVPKCLKRGGAGRRTCAACLAPASRSPSPGLSASRGAGARQRGGRRLGTVPKSERPRVAAVNCMALGDPRLVFSKVIEELGGGEGRRAQGTRAFAERDDVDLGADLGAFPGCDAQAAVTGGVDAEHGSSSKSVPTVIRWTRWTSSCPRRRASCTSFRLAHAPGVAAW